MRTYLVDVWRGSGGAVIRQKTVETPQVHFCTAVARLVRAQFLESFWRARHTGDELMLISSQTGEC